MTGVDILFFVITCTSSDNELFTVKYAFNHVTLILGFIEPPCPAIICAAPGPRINTAHLLPWKKTSKWQYLLYWPSFSVDNSKYFFVFNEFARTEGNKGCPAFSSLFISRSYLRTHLVDCLYIFHTIYFLYSTMTRWDIFTCSGLEIGLVPDDHQSGKVEYYWACPTRRVPCCTAKYMQMAWQNLYRSTIMMSTAQLQYSRTCNDQPP